MRQGECSDVEVGLGFIARHCPKTKTQRRARNVPGVEVHTFDPSAWEAEPGGSV